MKLDNSPAKRDTIRFIELDMETTLQLSLPGSEATRYVQHMRVILSRFKKIAKERGMRVRKFKMEQVEVKNDPNNPANVLVVLRKTQKPGHRLYENMIVEMENNEQMLKQFIIQEK